MSNRPKRSNARQSDFRVVARGINKQTPDISRLMRTSLDFYLALQEKEAQTDVIETPPAVKGDPDEAA